jgi:acyl carrier protein
MNSEEIYARLGGVFDDVFEYDGPLSAETTSDDVEEWDSIGHIRLILACEQAFGVSFKPNEVMGLKNLGELVDLIAAKAG